MDRNTVRNGFLEQKSIPFIGAFKQLIGAALSWLTLLIFFFTAITAWNTSTLERLRSAIPGLNLATFIAAILVGLVIVMFIEHKWIQPSLMVYWNKMFNEQGNAMKQDQDRIEAKLDLLLRHLGERSPELRKEIEKIDQDTK